MKYKYATDQKTENNASAVGKDLNISTKMAIEICNLLRDRNINDAKAILEQVISMDKPVPIKRFTDHLAHRPGIGAGRYPVNTAKEILKVIQNAETNAQNKGLSTHHLVLSHIIAQKAARPWRFGRHRRRKAKRTHIEVVVLEEKKKESK